jgi:hypothetical protein
LAVISFFTVGEFLFLKFTVNFLVKLTDLWNCVGCAGIENLEQFDVQDLCFFGDFWFRFKVSKTYSSLILLQS